MTNEHKPPVTLPEAIKMVAPLDPGMIKGAFTKEETELAYQRLVEFFSLLLPE